MTFTVQYGVMSTIAFWEAMMDVEDVVILPAILGGCRLMLPGNFVAFSVWRLMLFSGLLYLYLFCLLFYLYRCSDAPACPACLGTCLRWPGSGRCFCWSYLPTTQSDTILTHPSLLEVNHACVPPFLGRTWEACRRRWRCRWDWEGVLCLLCLFWCSTYCLFY
jgi:hypothetical protein